MDYKNDDPSDTERTLTNESKKHLRLVNSVTKTKIRPRWTTLIFKLDWNAEC